MTNEAAVPNQDIQKTSYPKFHYPELCYMKIYSKVFTIVKSIIRVESNDSIDLREMASSNIVLQQCYFGSGVFQVT